jgi:uncharacterized protein YdaU (DUF1376 family)
VSGEQFSGPWLPWYHGDFLRATQGWTIAERGVYFLLLGASWEMGPLPDDRRRLAGIVGAQLDEFDLAWKVVRRKFELTDKGFTNKRLEMHREKQADRSEKARQSAQNRWGKYANADANADASAYASGYAREDANRMLEGMRSACSSDLRDQNLEKDKNTEPRERGKTDRASRSALALLGDDFELTANMRAAAETERIDPDRTFAKFCDYHRAEGTRKKDWLAAWRLWCRRERDHSGNGATPPKPPRTWQEIEADDAAKKAAANATA